MSCVQCIDLVMYIIHEFVQLGDRCGVCFSQVLLNWLPVNHVPACLLKDGNPTMLA